MVRVGPGCPTTPVPQGIEPGPTSGPGSPSGSSGTLGWVGLPNPTRTNRFLRDGLGSGSTPPAPPHRRQPPRPRAHRRPHHHTAHRRPLGALAAMTPRHPKGAANRDHARHLKHPRLGVSQDVPLRFPRGRGASRSLRPTRPAARPGPSLRSPTVPTTVFRPTRDSRRTASMESGTSTARGD